MNVEVVVPFRGGCPHRQRALSWMLGRYAAEHPDWTITVAEAPPGDWCKALAVMPAVERSSAGVVAVADADVFTEGLAEAVERVEQGVAVWGQPHRFVHRLSEQGTAAVLAGDPWQQQPLDEPVYPGVWGGGVLVAHRPVLLDCPLDPRYTGWGQEDTSHGVALHCLHGPGWRGEHDLVHLFHPPQPRTTRRRGSRENWKLWCRYRAARANTGRMRALIEEVRDGAVPTDQPAVRSDAA